MLQQPPLQDTGGAPKPLSAAGESQEEHDALGTQCKTNKSMLERKLEELKRLF